MEKIMITVKKEIPEITEKLVYGNIKLKDFVNILQDLIQQYREGASLHIKEYYGNIYYYVSFEREETDEEFEIRKKHIEKMAEKENK